MLTSAPFDNWWHNAYGLDVKIVSPPHALLILGIRAISIGMLFLILAAMNRAADAGAANFKRLQILFLYLGGLSVGGQMFSCRSTPRTSLCTRLPPTSPWASACPSSSHCSPRHRASAGPPPPVLPSTPSFLIGEILILPLFPAQPKLGPVFFPVTHLVPARFPILILVPAMALDLFWQRARNWKPWQIALVSGVLFIAVLTAVEWPFANFLMSHASQNRFFGTMYFGYNTRPTSDSILRLFADPDREPRSTSVCSAPPFTPPSLPGSASPSAAGCEASNDEAVPSSPRSPARGLRTCSTRSCPHRQQGRL